MKLLNTELIIKKNKKGKFTKDNISRPNVSIGDYTYGVPEVLSWTDKYSLTIGKFCSIADNVKIFLDGNHRIDWISTYPFGELIDSIPANPGHPASKGNVRLGNDVWIGRDALILSGISIGNGAVIAAGAVVTKNVSDYEVVGGNPAKHIKFRFTEDQIAILDRVKWWDWPLSKITKYADLLQSSDIEKLLKV